MRSAGHSIMRHNSYDTDAGTFIWRCNVHEEADTARWNYLLMTSSLDDGAVDIESIDIYDRLTEK